MKQKIVMKVHMNCDKCRSKAMKHAAVAQGVTSVAIEGEEKDQVVVIGEEVDSADLTRLLRKKVGYASIISVEEVKPADGPEEDDKGAEEKDDPTPIQWSSSYIQYPQYPMYQVVYDPNPTGCSIM